MLRLLAPALTALLLLCLSALPGCDPDRDASCVAAYDHLTEVVERRPNEALKLRFVEACRNAWDEARMACLMKASDEAEALACKPARTRPG